MLLLSFYSAHFASHSLVTSQPLLGWIVALLVFFVATPILLSLVATVSSLSLRHARNELQKRLGQDSFNKAVALIEEEIRALPTGNNGWVALIRGQLVTAGQRVHVRLDLRNDENLPTARIESVRGPKLNLFGPRLDDLKDWHRIDRELQNEEANGLNEILKSLGPDSMKNAAAGSKLWLDIALLRVGEQSTTSRCRVRVNRPNQNDFPILSLVERAWLLSNWATDSP